MFTFLAECFPESRLVYGIVRELSFIDEMGFYSFGVMSLTRFFSFDLLDGLSREFSAEIV